MRMTSSEVIIDLVKRRFRPIDSNWESDALDIIGEGIDFMETKVGYELKWEIKTIENNRCRIPQSAESIEFVIYKGEKLNKGKYKSGLNPETTTVSAGTNDEAIRELENQSQRYDALTEMIAVTSDPTELASLIAKQEEVLEEIIRLSKIVQDKPVNLPNGTEFWYEQNHYIVTSFTSGDITIYYRRYFLDDNDYPMVIDNFKYKQGLYYYFISELISMGYEHKEIKLSDALQMAEVWKDRARNDLKAPTAEDLETLARMSVRMKFNPNLGKSNFKGV